MSKRLDVFTGKPRKGTVIEQIFDSVTPPSNKEVNEPTNKKLDRLINRARKDAYRSIKKKSGTYRRGK